MNQDCFLFYIFRDVNNRPNLQHLLRLSQLDVTGEDVHC